MVNRYKIIIGAGMVLMLLVLGVVYKYCDPSHELWMPKCVFHSVTGWDCPACGNQRALHSALNGQWRQAFGYNPFSIIFLPYFMMVALTSFLGGKRMARVRHYVQHRVGMWIYFCLFFLWWVFRNTAWWKDVSENLFL